MFSVLCSLSEVKVLGLFYGSDLSPSAGAGYPELSASVYKSPGVDRYTGIMRAHHYLPLLLLVLGDFSQILLK